MLNSYKRAPMGTSNIRRELEMWPNSIFWIKRRFSGENKYQPLCLNFLAWLPTIKVTKQRNYFYDDIATRCVSFRGVDAKSHVCEFNYIYTYILYTFKKIYSTFVAIYQTTAIYITITTSSSNQYNSNKKYWRWSITIAE